MSLFSSERSTEGTEITVIVNNISSEEGEILFSLHTENTFMKTNPPFTASAKIINGTAKVVFMDVPEGIYAITCFHDKNGNELMDYEFTGRPAESYGVSNNSTNPYGPPEWNEIKFEVGEESQQFNIKLTR